MQVLFIDAVHEILEQRLRTHDFECIDATQWDKATCEAAMEEVEGIVIRSRFPMNEAFLQHAPNLKFIARSGAGMENIDLNYTNSKGIICFNAPEGNRNAVAEHALGMLLNLFNRLLIADQEVRKGIWRRAENRGVELDGKTIGIIGFGNNGSAFAHKLAGFDVQILAYDKYKTNFGTDRVKETTMDEIFEQCDVVSLHIPQNEETLFMVDATFLQSFKKSIYLINLSRGKIVSTRALVAGLTTGKVAGACLDVLEYESTSFENSIQEEKAAPLQYLLDSDKVILSPHVGGWTKESYFKLSNVLADKILNAFG